ncbi:putative Transposase-associated domain-containing protein [Helianthus annuus]|nr:putative Transposase-associated domain-containing protein [Helianthus annuus]
MYEISRASSIYMEGVKSFLKAAEANRVNRGSRMIYCPCQVCNNFMSFNDITDIEFHLVKNGFMPKYTCWSMHGESLLDHSTSSINSHINDNRENNDTDLDADNDHSNSNEPDNNLNEMLHDMETNISDDEQENLQHLFEEAEKPLYAGCKKFNKLDAVLKLFNVKSKNGWSDKSFTNLLVLLHDMLPEGNELPISTYQAKKLMCPMGLEVERIHACPNDCMLYRKEFEDLHECLICHASRYKRKKESDEDEYDNDVTKNGPPAKMLWYLPIIPRLKRLFSNEKEAKLLRWHSDERVIDGKQRHVADSPQWTNIDDMYPEFGKEIRNIRFGLSSDGINPFGNRSSCHSTWPVLLCIYNLPPWLCMKRKYIMMSLLIQGPTQPGNDIDVYLSPLIDDLKTLWSSGVDVYDAYMKERFQLRAMIFCTISDFPAYGNLSGYSTKGKKACPVCEEETSSIWLKNCKKTVYMGHRRFLPAGHIFRKKTTEFNGSTELGSVRKRFDAFSRVEKLTTVLGKRTRVNKRAIDKKAGKRAIIRKAGKRAIIRKADKRAIDTKAIWKKKSIFWDLPYWKHLDVRHCLDVMHIEKNVCDSLLGLLLDIHGKTKDGLNVRRDMEKMGIRKELAPVERDNRLYLPPACYTMSKAEKEKFCKCLHDIKVPSNYSANIKRLVSMKDRKLLGMKSHDCHVLMTHMIPIAIRGLLPDNIRHTITKLCLFFNNINSKVIDSETLDEWQKDIIVTLCELEMYFPPSFFDIMVHLICHIVQEIKACGPVFLRYMYPFERYMGFLKGYVRNTNRPEGSIVEGYTCEEVTEFCQGYLEGAESVGVPKSRHSGRLDGKGVVGMKTYKPNHDSLQLAHLVVLKHMTCLSPYVDEHLNTLRSTYPGKEQMWYVTKHNKEFSRWMKSKVMGADIDKTVKRLAQGPNFIVKSYQGYDINGYTFYTKDQDLKSTMQNSGVTIIASATEFDRVDHNIMRQIANNSYYGVIQEIWELDYYDFIIPVFKCKWVNNRTSVRVDKYGFTLVDLTSNGYASEPFVLARHVTQVFYVNDPSKPTHHIVLQGKRRILGVDNVVDEEEYDHFDDLPPFSVGIEPGNYDNINGTPYLRTDHTDGIYVD